MATARASRKRDSSWDCRSAQQPLVIRLTTSPHKHRLTVHPTNLTHVTPERGIPDDDKGYASPLCSQQCNRYCDLQHPLHTFPRRDHMQFSHLFGRSALTAIALGTVMTLTACAGMTPSQNRAAATAAGAAAGAAIGEKSGGRTGAAIGAAVGAGTASVIVDRQQ